MPSRRVSLALLCARRLGCRAPCARTAQPAGRSPAQAAPCRRCCAPSFNASPPPRIAATTTGCQLRAPGGHRPCAGRHERRILCWRAAGPPPQHRARQGGAAAAVAPAGATNRGAVERLSGGSRKHHCAEGCPCAVKLQRHAMARCVAQVLSSRVVWLRCLVAAIPFVTSEDVTSGEESVVPQVGSEKRHGCRLQVQRVR